MTEQTAPVDTYVVARSIRKWAVQVGLLPPYPDHIEEQLTGPVTPVQLSHDAESLLRQKCLQSISYNERSQTIFLYTKIKVYKKDYKILPVSLSGCGISYPQGSVDEIGREPAGAQGAVSYIITCASSSHYACGSSISPGNSASAGTLGALVRDANGIVYGLSNNHVTGCCNHTPVGMPILAPGVMDVFPGVIHPFTLGMHHSVLPMNVGTQGIVNVAENRDAAIFVLNSQQLASSMQGNFYDTPQSVLPLSPGMAVEKVGRTSGHTTGTVMGRELGPITVSVNSPQHGFSGNIMFEDVWSIHGDRDAFSSSGDSGSLVVHRDGQGNRHAVGLIFAGGKDSSAPGETRSLVFPIGPILERFNVQLVGGLNVPENT